MFVSLSETSLYGERQLSFVKMFPSDFWNNYDFLTRFCIGFRDAHCQTPGTGAVESAAVCLLILGAALSILREIRARTKSWKTRQLSAHKLLLHHG